jgi:hypothetical protein
MKSIAGLAAALLLLATTPAFAQGGVAPGAGVQRGLESMNNSGQNGFVTLFAAGAKTNVVVDVHASAGPKNEGETAAVQRGKGCKSIGSTIVAKIGTTVKGIAKGSVPMAQSALLSGNYVVTVWNGKNLVSCGALYH